MYNDDDTSTFIVPASGAAGGAAVKLVVRQTMEEEDLCSIFDDAWLGSRVRARALRARHARQPT